MRERNVNDQTSLFKPEQIPQIFNYRISKMEKFT